MQRPVTRSLLERFQLEQSQESALTLCFVAFSDEKPVSTFSENALASFIEYTAKGCVTPQEWNRFIIQHYQDDEMENARRECARILGSKRRRELATEMPRPLSAAAQNALISLASELRQKTYDTILIKQQASGA